MKKLFRLAALAAVTLPLMVACKPNGGNDNNNPENNPVILELSGKEFSVPATGGTIELKITTNVYFSITPAGGAEKGTEYEAKGCVLNEPHEWNWFTPEQENEIGANGYCSSSRELTLTFTVYAATEAQDDTFEYEIQAVTGTPVGGEYYHKDATVTITRKGLGEINIPEGALTGIFSVAEDKHVFFAKGNLQYIKNSNEWRFADEQTEVLAEKQGNKIDLFCYGTSGFDGFEPTLDGEQYNALNPSFYDIAGTEYDWGVHNAIANGGNEAGLWRTLTLKEWTYLLNERPNADELKKTYVPKSGHLLVFPDNWEAVLRKLGKLEQDLTEKELTQAGVLILPVTYSNYWNGNFDQQVTHGMYWTSTAANEDPLTAHALNVDYQGIPEFWEPLKSEGHAVRLVADIK